MASAGGIGAANETEAAKNIIIIVDLVVAARKQLQLLKAVGNMPYLHHGPVIAEAIRKFVNKLFMADYMKCISWLQIFLRDS